MRFQVVFFLSIPSVPTLCLKDPSIKNDTIHPEIILTVDVIRWEEVAWVLVIQRQEELSPSN